MLWEQNGYNSGFKGYTPRPKTVAIVFIPFSEVIPGQQRSGWLITQAAIITPALTFC
jgi:hypothetical protein